MALEHRNPLPVGRYWIDAIGASAIDSLDRWLAANNTTVHVVNSKFDPGEAGPFTNPLEQQWVLFEVTEPTRWTPTFSVPTIAPYDVATRDDTVQRPPPEQIPSLFEAMNRPFEGIEALVLLYLLSQAIK